jgi:hypothetical protein
LTDQKTREVATTNIPTNHIYSNLDSPFRNSKEAEKIFNARPADNYDWRKQKLLNPLKLNPEGTFLKNR